VYKREIYQTAESNQIEKIDSVARIESNRIETFFCPNWNALVTIRNTTAGGHILLIKRTVLLAPMTRHSPEVCEIAFGTCCDRHSI